MNTFSRSAYLGPIRAWPSSSQAFDNLKSPDVRLGPEAAGKPDFVERLKETRKQTLFVTLIYVCNWPKADNSFQLGALMTVAKGHRRSLSIDIPGTTH